MVSYKELGLVNTREMFAKAVAGGYAIPAFNFNNMEQLQAIIKAAATKRSPVILQVSRVRVPTLTRHSSDIWLRVLSSMQRSSDGRILRSFSIWTTVTLSRLARAAWIWAFLQ